MNYLLVLVPVMLGFCSFGVDYGRYQLTKMQLSAAADGAALAAAAQIPSGTATAQSAAVSVVALNKIDGVFGTSANVTVDVQFLDWISPTVYTSLPSATGANAVRVSITRQMPLLWTRYLGVSTKRAVKSATAKLVSTSTTPYVRATGNLWLAGEPTGTRGSKPDPYYKGPGVNPVHPWQYDYAGPVGGTMSNGESYASPTQASIIVSPGSLITITNVSGTATYDPGESAMYGCEGDSTTILNNTTANNYAEHGIADTRMPASALCGVFLTDNRPDTQTPPSTLDFSSQTARDYSTLMPVTQQPFYIGNGQTSGGSQQEIVVPAGATRFFLGVMDCWEWNNNVGGFNLMITQKSVELVK